MNNTYNARYPWDIIFSSVKFSLVSFSDKSIIDQGFFWFQNLFPFITNKYWPGSCSLKVNCRLEVNCGAVSELFSTIDFAIMNHVLGVLMNYSIVDYKGYCKKFLSRNLC